ncbi:MAG: dihydroxyacetone kinase ADP-binding subunit DhaL [Anaerolineales bacterium]|nr:dihydroxyacetone kinase ADP-binding subunit DhaL [Anaerolineales bacterium]MCB8952757.1 dihydroxyacetone kinase ADP-binding subunit DhaL [Ardenticatenales bacterium]
MVVTKVQIVQWLENLAAVLFENKEYLTQLDSAIGDADHGINMARGFTKVLEKLPGVADKDIGNVLKTVGMTLISSVGGASGPLYGTFFMRSGMAVGAKEELNGEDLYELFKKGVDGIVQRGRPQLEDKTMFDTWSPALVAMRQALDNNKALIPALEQAVTAANAGMLSTIPLQARKGRASYLGERSIGHQDPGATSSYLMLKALLDTLQTA